MDYSMFDPSHPVNVALRKREMRIKQMAKEYGRYGYNEHEAYIAASYEYDHGYRRYLRGISSFLAFLGKGIYITAKAIAWVIVSIAILDLSFISLWKIGAMHHGLTMMSNDDMVYFFGLAMVMAFALSLDKVRRSGRKVVAQEEEPSVITEAPRVEQAAPAKKEKTELTMADKAENLAVYFVVVVLLLITIGAAQKLNRMQRGSPAVDAAASATVQPEPVTLWRTGPSVGGTAR